MARDVVWSRIAVIAVLIIGFAFLAPSASDAARPKRLHTGKDVKGIAFEDFWAKAREEAGKWGGPRLRVRRVLSLNVVGFDGRNGRSPAWEAQFVRCDKAPRQPGEEEESAAGGSGKVCKGRTITLRLIEKGVTGTESGLNISKETYFRGAAFPVEKITVSPQKAEDTANNHRQYNPVETDTYAYELKLEPRKDRPVWVIKRTCGYRGKAEGRCIPGDYWIVKIDAQSGEVVKPEKWEKTTRPPKIETPEEDKVEDGN